MIVVFTNILVACLSQILYYSFFEDMVDGAIFQFVIHPLLIVIINIFMGFKFKIKFYQYSLSAYLGFFLSIVTSTVIVLFINKPEELPPGETLLHADVLYSLFVSLVQTIILLLLNLIIYGIYIVKKVVR